MVVRKHVASIKIAFIICTTWHVFTSQALGKRKIAVLKLLRSGIFQPESLCATPMAQTCDLMRRTRRVMVVLAGVTPTSC